MLNFLTENNKLLEIAGVLFGLLSVWYSKKENILVFPTGIISVIIYMYLCYNFKLYADFLINSFYFLMSIYGWIKWSMKKNNVSISISSFSTATNVLLIIITFILWGILFFLLSTYTDSDVSAIDSLTTAIFFVGMFLMAWKKIENWIYWMIGNGISIPLYWYKELHFTSLQFIIFAVLALLGYLEWKKKLTTIK